MILSINLQILFYEPAPAAMAQAYLLNDITFQYQGKLALALPELRINAGETTALIGPNGSGKSTLLNILAFLSLPATGKMHFFADEVKKNQRCGLQKRVGFLQQNPYMLRGTVADNIKLALKLHGCAKAGRQKKIKTALQQLDIQELAEHQAKNLSGGELQKAALARILASDPEVLLLDEPFSYLDQSSTERLETFIARYARETRKTLIFSTHNRLQGLALADNVVSLVQGKSVNTPLINIYHGIIQSHGFDTGKITIRLPDVHSQGAHVSIDPHDIVVSRESLNSSMRNTIRGRVINIAEELGNVRIAVDAGEIFQALITHAALHELKLQLGDTAWINFKSNSVVIF